MSFIHVVYPRVVGSELYQRQYDREAPESVPLMMDCYYESRKTLPGILRIMGTFIPPVPLWHTNSSVWRNPFRCQSNPPAQSSYQLYYVEPAR